ncbi:unnamed protein product [Agarophyton chilense]
MDSHIFPYPFLPVHKQSCFSTGSFSALHRHHYDSVPRLFPSQIQADVLFGPQPFQTTSSFITVPTPELNDRSVLTKRNLFTKTTFDSQPSNRFDLVYLQKNEFQIKNSFEEVERFKNEAWEKSKSETVSPPCYSLPSLHEERKTERKTVQPTASSFAHQDHSRFRKENCVGFGTQISTKVGGNKKTIAFSPTGFLRSVVIAELDIQNNEAKNPKHTLKNIVSPSQVPDFLLTDESPLHDIASSSVSDSPGLATILATTRNRLTVATLENNKLHWKDQFLVLGVASTVFSPICPDEFALLCDEGLFTGNADTLHHSLMRTGMHDNFKDLQPLSQASVFRVHQLQYGWHPRTLLLSTQDGIVLHDLRVNYENKLGHQLLNVKWNTLRSKRYISLGPFQPLRKEKNFFITVATSSALQYFDIRKTSLPLLEWSLSNPSSIDSMCILEISNKEHISDTIVLSSHRCKYLEVFHAIEAPSQMLTEQIILGDDCSLQMMPPLTRMIWTDMPLSNLTQLKVPAVNRAVALVQQNEKNHISLLQFSVEKGLQAQLLSIEKFFNGTKSFETSRTEKKHSVDASVSLWMQQQLLHKNDEHLAAQFFCNCNAYYFPGLLLLKRTKKLFWKDAIDLRHCLNLSENDDVGQQNEFFIPRPFLGNVWRKSKEMTKSRQFSPEEVAFSTESTDSNFLLKDQINNRKKQISTLFDKHREEDIEAGLRELSAADLTELRDLTDIMTGGCTIDEIARCLRSGSAHSPTPLTVQNLEESLNDSRDLFTESIEWHSNCLELHDLSTTQVDSNEELPNWVNRMVYFRKELDSHITNELFNTSEATEYSLFLQRMISFWGK